MGCEETRGVGGATSPMLGSAAWARPPWFAMTRTGATWRWTATRGVLQVNGRSADQGGPRSAEFTRIFVEVSPNSVDTGLNLAVAGPNLGRNRPPSNPISLILGHILVDMVRFLSNIGRSRAIILRFCPTFGRLPNIGRFRSTGPISPVSGWHLSKPLRLCSNRVQIWPNTQIWLDAHRCWTEFC